MTALALGAAFTIPTTTAGAQSAPAIAALTDGSFVVAWFDTPRNGVYGQRFSATGVKIGVEFNLGGTSGYSEPSMALLGDGRLVAGLTFAESGPNFNVYAEIFDPRTSVTGTNGDDILTSRLDGAVVSELGGADTLVGFAGNDTLDGGAGNDHLEGRTGNDTYVIDGAGDVLVDTGGVDTVNSTITTTLAAGFEHLTLLGSLAVNGTGNTSANVMTGNTGANTLVGLDGNDTLDGGAGIDQLEGGDGDDTYTIDSASEVLVETLGTDLVRSTVTKTLAAGFENLTLLGTASLNGTGNTSANVITGNTGDNILDGGTGADTLIGGGGNDTYIIDNTSDVLIETTGIDMIHSPFSRTLAAGFENLTLLGTANLAGSGNTSANVITGNTGANVLLGFGGNDRSARRQRQRYARRRCGHRPAGRRIRQRHLHYRQRERVSGRARRHRPRALHRDQDARHGFREPDAARHRESRRHRQRHRQHHHWQYRRQYLGRACAKRPAHRQQRQ